jgi:hypothetical protein
MNENLQPQQPVAPQTPPEKPMELQQSPEMQPAPKEKLPLVSILAIVIILVAIAGYVALASFYDLWPFSYTEPEMEATPTPVGMLTYVNDDYGFKFRYPRGGEVIEITKDFEDRNLDQQWIDMRHPIIYRSPELVKDIETNPQRYAGDIVADAYVDILDNEIGLIDMEVDNIGKQFDDRKEKLEWIFFGDISATKATVTTPSHPDWIWTGIFIETGNHLVKISNGAILERAEAFKDFYESFEFDMSKWKTYSSSTYNYSVTYPPEWTVAQYSPEDVEIKVAGPYAISVLIKVLNLKEFDDAYGEATVAAEEITLDSGFTAFRFEKELEIGITVVITYLRLGQDYLVLRHGPGTSQAEQVIQSLQIN